MNRSVFPILLVLLPLMGLSQNAQQKNGFGINQDFHDYNVKLLDNKLTSFDSSLSQSLRISYNRHLGSSWALSVGITNGFLLNQTEENKLIKKSYMFGGDIDLLLTLNNGRFFPVASRVAPYLSFGYNFNYLDAYKELGITPMVISNEYGFGAFVRLGPKSKIQLGAALNQQLNGEFDTHVQYRLGFAQTIGKDSKQPVVPPKNKDYDNDGVVDADDNCPTLAGVSSNMGCPESFTKGGDNSFMNDSIYALIDDLEQSLLKLKSDLYNIANNQIIVVESDSKTDEVPVTASNKTNKPEEDADKAKKDDPIVSDKKDVPETDDTTKPTSDKKADPVIAQKVDQPEGDKTRDKPTNPAEPLVQYKNKSDGNAYYVIAISTKDRALAERSARLIANDFQMVKVLPQPNGFYRVGIYATKTKDEALKILEYAKNHGIPSGWIAYE